MQRLTLAQQIAQLENTAPTDFDPEDIYGGNANDNLGPENDKDVDMDIHDPNSGREHYVDVGPSELRKLREGVADPKYDGIKTSRHQLHTNEDLSEEDADNSQSGSHEEEGTPSIHGDSLSSELEDEETHSPIPYGVANPTMDNKVCTHPKDCDSTSLSNYDEKLVLSLQRTRLADKLKGKAVSQQLKIWDSLVDTRIRLQKCVTTANKLPHPENLPPYVSTADGRVAARRFLTEALMLSEDLFELRNTLLAKAGSVQPARKRRRINPEEEDLDLESLLEESTTEMMTFDAQTHPYTLSTLQKWSAKVQAVAPSALLLSSRTSFKSGAHIKSAAELVEDALREQGKAVKRTWGKAGARIGGTTLERDGDEGDEETFDDRDFYQAMLRDVIESKGSKDGIDVADLYANSKKQKKKKTVDTKASKGRKLRYEPHEKLQNFMVPVPVRGAWHEEQIDELFASLFGKGFEGYEGYEPVRTINELETGLKKSEMMQNFRLFG